ncbi:hypothetical protein RSA31_17530 [Pantoea dispersa]|nr:hypothetical protein NS215_03180 [Pantoea dispersa]KTS86574.1 hypothetical protein RSA31_17530 [Pantoea dispersa]
MSLKAEIYSTRILTLRGGHAAIAILLLPKGRWYVQAARLKWHITLRSMKLLRPGNSADYLGQW